MNEMSEPESSLNPLATVAATLQIPEGTFVLTYDELDPEAIIPSVKVSFALCFHEGCLGFQVWS